MWYSNISKVDATGLQPELKVTVTYSNDGDDRTYDGVYYILPEVLGSDDFNTLIQNQVDILNAKDNVAPQIADTTVSMNNQMSKPISVNPISIKP